MTAYYRNRETGIVQAHPVSGLGEFFNAEEVGLDGKPVKPVIPLGASAAEQKRLTKLAKATAEATAEAIADGEFIPADDSATLSVDTDDEPTNQEGA
jgi:hypothetical protein